MYGKIFASLWNGSLVGRSAPQLVLVYLVSNCDPSGNADFHPRLIASQTGLSESDVRQALVELESPDTESRSEAESGARIVRIDEHRDWGWHIVNYKYYRGLKDNDEVRSQTNKRVQKHREKKRSVTLGNAQKRHVEGEGEGEEEEEEEPSLVRSAKNPNGREGDSVSAAALARCRIRFNTIDIETIEAKLLARHAKNPYKNLDLALVNWCKKAEAEGWDKTPGQVKSQPRWEP